MALNYIKTPWVNGTPPAVSATNLNHVENGVKTASDALDTPATMAPIVATAIEAGTAATTPNDTDKFANVKADHSLLYYTWANIKIAIYAKLYDWLVALTAQTTLADGDTLWIGSAAASASRKIAASLIMRRVKMPDGATAVYSNKTWADADGFTGTGVTFSTPSTGVGRWTFATGIYFGKTIATALYKKVWLSYKTNGVNPIIIANGSNELKTLPASPSGFNIALVQFGAMVSGPGYLSIAGTLGDYVDINGIWIGDYSYLPGSLSEEAARIADQLGDTNGVGIAARGTITNNGTAPNDGETVTISGKVYTYKTTLGTTEGQVLIGASAAEAAQNLVYAINYTGTPGTNYYCAAAHPLVLAVLTSSTVVTLSARSTGELGNSITIATTSATLTLSGSRLSGGYSDVAAKIITATQNNIAASGTRPAAAMIEYTNTALAGYENTVDVAAGATFTLPANGTFIWAVNGYGATINSLKKGTSAGGTTLTVNGANSSVWYRRSLA